MTASEGKSTFTWGPKGAEKDRCTEYVFVQIIAENLPNLWWETGIQTRKWIDPPLKSIKTALHLDL